MDDDDDERRPPPPEAAPPETADERATRLRDAGDRRGAIAVLMDAHGDAVLAYCIRVLRDREQAREVVQQTFLEAHRDLDRFRREAAYRTWLIGIAAHRCSDLRKAKRRRESRIGADERAVDAAIDPGAAVDARVERAGELRALEECLQELAPEIRETVLLRFISGMRYEELAATLGKKADTLCVRVARALPVLKRCLERKGWRRG